MRQHAVIMAMLGVVVVWALTACASETSSPDATTGGGAGMGGSAAVGGGGSGGAAADGGGGSGGLALGSSIAVEVESSRGVTVKTVFISPSSPAKRAVILLEGGEGKVNIGGSADSPVINSQGFLARSAQALADEGLLVALMDAPSDFADGLTLAYRTSADQATDVAAVVAWLQSKVSVPIWVLGMSVGTYSATNTAIRLGDEIDGYGVCSASTQPGGAAPHPNGILDLQLDQITVPSLVFGHQEDKCPGTPSSGVAKIVAALSNAKSVTDKIFTGGDPPKSSDCGPLAPHGYFGIESEVIPFVAKTIEAN